MRIALVWHGEMREFSLAHWAAFINIHKPDIFLHTWSRSWVYPQLPQINIKAALIEQPLDFEDHKNNVTQYESSALNVLPQMYSIMKADTLRTDYQRHKAFQYDYVMRSRFDISLHNPNVNFGGMSSAKMHVCSNHWKDINGMYDDNVMVMGKTFEHVSQFLWDEVHEYIYNKKVIPSGEQLLSHYIRTNKLMSETVKNHALDFTLMRHL